jgi:hypothetical protein
MPENKGACDFYVVIHVWTTSDEHGVCVSRDTAEVIEVSWILINTKTLEEVCCPAPIVRSSAYPLALGPS